MTASDGSTADYYELPAGATQLQDLISHRNLNAQDGEMFRAIYRKGRASHSDELRDAKKVLFYAQAEVARLERLRGAGLPCNNPVRAFHSDPMPEPAAAMEDDGTRMQVIGQNGNDGAIYREPAYVQTAVPGVNYCDGCGRNVFFCTCAC